MKDRTGWCRALDYGNNKVIGRLIVDIPAGSIGMIIEVGASGGLHSILTTVLFDTEPLTRVWFDYEVPRAFELVG